MSKQEELNGRLEQAAELGDVAALAQALEGGANARFSCSWALSLAAGVGHVECVRRLIEVSDPLERDSMALRWAAVKGHADCVALLLPASDPLAMESGVDAAVWARVKGHMEVAGMIEAFIESKELMSGLADAHQRLVAKKSL